MRNAYSKSVEEVLGFLNTTVEGLTVGEAKSRLEKHGPNKLPEGKSAHAFGKNQF